MATTAVAAAAASTTTGSSVCYCAFVASAHGIYRKHRMGISALAMSANWMLWLVIGWSVYFKTLITIATTIFVIGHWFVPPCAHENN